MKVILEPADSSEPEVIIRGDVNSQQVRNLLNMLKDKQTLHKMFFFKDAREYLFDISDVYYFEADNNKTLARVGKDIYEVHHKLYELESIGRTKGFIRISKGVIVNINTIRHVEAEFSGNYSVFLKDGSTRLTISRKYVKEFRKFVMEVY